MRRMDCMMIAKREKKYEIAKRSIDSVIKERAKGITECFLSRESIASCQSSV